MKPYHLIGIDPGKRPDPTALVLIEWDTFLQPVYRLRGLHCLPLGTPHTELPSALKPRLMKEPLAGRVALVIDATGVGGPIVDLFHQQVPEVPLYAITITAGTRVTGKSKEPNVPKRDLIGAASVVLEQRRIRVAANMRETETLADELLAYRRTISEHGNDTYAAPSGSHDDLVLALSLALWTAEKRQLVPRPYRRQRYRIPDVRMPTTDDILAANHRRLYNWHPRF